MSCMKTVHSALHAAASSGNMKDVKTELSNGAIYNAPDADGKIAVDFAKDEQIRKFLELIGDAFRGVVSGDSKFLHTLAKVNELDAQRAIMNARNSEKQTLVVAGYRNGYSKTKDMEVLWQKNVEGEIEVAMSLALREKFVTAEEQLNRLLKRRADIFGSDNPATLKIEEKLTDVIYKQRKLDEALKRYTFIHQKLVNQIGGENKFALRVECSAALVREKQGEFNEALAIFQKNYEKQKRILPEDHPDLMKTIHFVGMSLFSLERFAEANEYNYKAFEISKRKNGELNEATLSIQNNIALNFSRQKKYQKAIDVYRDVYLKRQLRLGEGHSDTLRTLHNMGLAHESMKNHSEAMKTLFQALKMQKQHLGPNHFDTLNTQANLGRILAMEGKVIRAYRMLNESVMKQSEMLGPNHPHTAPSLQHYNALRSVFQVQGIDPSNLLTTNIMEATKDGAAEIVEDILESKPNDVNMADQEGRTPLHLAVNGGHREIIALLLNQNVDVTKITKKGNTVLHTAALQGCKVVAQMVIAYAKQTVKNQTKLNEFINAQTSIGRSTALHVCAKKGHMDIVKLLLRNGAIYDIVDSDGNTPVEVSTDENVRNYLAQLDHLFEACRNGTKSIIEEVKIMKSEDLMVDMRLSAFD